MVTAGDDTMTKAARDIRADIARLLAEREQIDIRRKEIARNLHAARMALKRATHREQGDPFASLIEILS
jgi:AraC-like DNA-binding protein